MKVFTKYISFIFCTLCIQNAFGTVESTINKDTQNLAALIDTITSPSTDNVNSNKDATVLIDPTTTHLDSIFNVKFGSTIASTESTKVSNSEELYIYFTPQKQFKKFTEYIKFYSPVSKKIYKVSAICNTSTPEEVFNETKSILKKKYGFISDEENGIFSFDNGQVISILKKNTSVVIDAIDKTLYSLAQQEKYNSLAKNLKITRNEQDFISSILDIKFGSAIDSSFKKKENFDNIEFFPKDNFLDYNQYFVFTTALSEKIYEITLAYSGENLTTTKALTQNIIETVFETKFNNELSLIYKNLYCCIEIEPNSNSLLLRFINIDLYNEHQTEKNQKAINEMDLDAL
jgi:hypothetical protein